jgi:hypothetical protein
MLFWISIGVALLMAVLLFRLFFSGLPDFMESFFRLNVCTLKLAIWAAVAIGMGIGSYYILPRHIPQLARHRDAKETAATEETSSKPIVAKARANSVATAPPLAATSRGVKLGDTVQISATNPAVALRSALITSLDDTQLTVRATSGSYTILWKDLTVLRPAVATVKTNR